MENLALGLTAFTAFGIVVYWTLVFEKKIPSDRTRAGVQELVHVLSACRWLDRGYFAAGVHFPAARR